MLRGMELTLSKNTPIVLALGLLAIAPAAAAGREDIVPAAKDTSAGRIAYVAEGIGTPQLFTISPDGTGRTQVTHLRKGQEVANPDWSHDGLRVAYEAFDGKNHAGVFVAAADGTDAHDLTPKGFQGQPAFSPDGRTIVFEREAGGNGLALMNADGSHVRRLTRNPFAHGEDCGCDTDPNFAPDGRTITFVRVKQDDKLAALFSLRLDGTHLRRLTPYAWDLAIKHDWAPDGSRIAISTDANGGSANIVTIRPDGTGARHLTSLKNGDGAFVGSYSPDGNRLAFRLERVGGYPAPAKNTSGGG